MGRRRGAAPGPVAPADSMSPALWRTGHSRFFPGRPEQLELTAEISTAETPPKAARVLRAEALVGRAHVLVATLDAIADGLAALRGPT